VSVCFFIRQPKEAQSTMQIILKQRDIEQALALYIRDQGINLTNKTLSVAFTAGRKEGGLTAEIDIEDATDTSGAPTLPSMTRREASAAVPDEDSSPFDTPTASADSDDEIPSDAVIQAAQTVAKASAGRSSLFS